MALYRTVLVIWSESDPRKGDLEDLARAATCGDAILVSQETSTHTVEQAANHDDTAAIQGFFPDVQAHIDHDA